MRRLSLVVLLAAALAAPACRKKAGAPTGEGPTAAPRVPTGPAVLAAVKVEDRTPADLHPARLDLDAIGVRGARALAKASGLVYAAPDAGVAPSGDGPRYRLKASVTCAELPPGHGEGGDGARGKMRALVEVRVEPLGAELGALTFDDDGVAERAFDAGAHRQRDRDWNELVGRLLEDLLAQVGGRMKLATGDEPALVAALGGQDETLRDEAIRLAGERRAKVAVPALVKLLADPNGAVRDRAIGALSAIGDPRAVKPLTEGVRFADLTELAKVIDALGRIGGTEAKAYLELVAAGHDSPEMRREAQKALDRLARRAADAGAPL